MIIRRDRSSRLLCTDLWLSEVSLAALKACAGLDLDEADKRSTRRLRERLERDLKNSERHQGVLTATDQDKLEDALAVVTATQEKRDALDVASIRRFLRFLDDFAASWELTEAEATELISAIHDLDKTPAGQAVLPNLPLDGQL